MPDLQSVELIDYIRAKGSYPVMLREQDISSPADCRRLEIPTVEMLQEQVTFLEGEVRVLRENLMIALDRLKLQYLEEI